MQDEALLREHAEPRNKNNPGIKRANTAAVHFKVMIAGGISCQAELCQCRYGLKPGQFPKVKSNRGRQ
jgi:hypothetical protein